MSFVEEESKLHPMMMLSNKTCEEEWQRSWTTGNDASVTKPCGEAELVARVKSSLATVESLAL